MDGFFNWVRNVSYDIVALIIPGMLLITLVFYVWEGGFIFEKLSFSSASDLNNNGFFYTLIFILLSYIAGIILKSISSLKFIKANFRKDLPNYNPEYEALYNKAKEILELKLKIGKINSWNEFYILTKIYIQSKGIPSTLATFQNRYELCSSLSVAFAILFFEQLILIGINFCGQLNIYMPRSYTEALFLTLAFLFISFLFRSTFRRYWTDLGAQVIAHAATAEK